MLKHLGTRRDVLALLLVTAVAGIIRVHHLSLPRNFILDELYASDGCLYIGHPPSECRTDAEITSMHPPLAKWMIGAGIWAFGFREAGWRITAAVAGTLTIAALYLLARTVLNSTLAATLASGLLAIDFLHFAFSRTAMLDIFVTFFIVIAFLCLAYYRAYVSSSLRWGALAFGGIAAGAAGASKWSAWPALVAMMGLCGSVGTQRAASARSSDNGTPRDRRSRSLSDTVPRCTAALRVSGIVRGPSEWLTARSSVGGRLMDQCVLRKTEIDGRLSRRAQRPYSVRFTGLVVASAETPGPLIFSGDTA